jgi:hypothetical protein
VAHCEPGAAQPFGRRVHDLGTLGRQPCEVRPDVIDQQRAHRRPERRELLRATFKDQKSADGRERQPAVRVRRIGRDAHVHVVLDAE